MRRLIALALLLLLPLQAIWAAAQPYCQHEQGGGVFHVGHHMHQHHADEGSHGADAKKISNASSVADHDHHCCGFLSILPSSLQAPDFLLHGEWVVAPHEAYGHVVMPRIERPNWSISR